MPFDPMHQFLSVPADELIVSSRIEVGAVKFDIRKAEFVVLS
jgi:hypothetical protein